MTLDDTIVAVASAPGGAWRGIVRVSGPDVADCLSRCLPGSATESLAATKRPGVVRTDLQLHGLAKTLPCDIFFWPSRRSYTRQVTAEIHTVGSPPLLDAVVDTVCRCGARLAEPGEFTLRAFLAGRLDLTQAEAVLGVIDARDREQLDVALRQLAGGLAGPLGRLRGELLDLLADLEAGLDFVDEDIEFISHGDVLRQLNQAVGAAADVRRQMTTRGAAAGEPRVVLVGRPNVGKSSLMNVLAGDRAALVDAAPGTTRDYLSRRLDLEGLGCVVIDTAGVSDRAGRTAIDAAAQRVTAEQSRQSDIRVLCLDAARGLDAWEQQQLASGWNEENCLVALTKCDLLAGRQPPPGCPAGAVLASSKTGAGVDKLRDEIRRRAEEFLQPETNVVAGTAARCQDSLRLAEESLHRARDLAAHRGGDELVAAEVRTALSELGKVVGAVYTDDVLDRVFSRFCIGK